MSVEQERAIAQKYIGGFPWFMEIWGTYRNNNWTMSSLSALI